MALPSVSIAPSAIHRDRHPRRGVACGSCIKGQGWRLRLIMRGSVLPRVSWGAQTPRGGATQSRAPQAMPLNAARRAAVVDVRLYFGRAGTARARRIIRPLVSLTDDVEHEGQRGVRIDTPLKRGLLLAHHEDDRHVDSYWPMQGNTTVFGFGRKGLGKFMTKVPARPGHVARTQ